jgi:hypothetical protein
MTGYGLADCGCVLSRSRDLLLHHRRVQIGSAVHTSSCVIGSGKSFAGPERGDLYTPSWRGISPEDQLNL